MATRRLSEREWRVKRQRTVLGKLQRRRAEIKGVISRKEDALGKIDDEIMEIEWEVGQLDAEIEAERALPPGQELTEEQSDAADEAWIKREHERMEIQHTAWKIEHEARMRESLAPKPQPATTVEPAPQPAAIKVGGDAVKCRRCGRPGAPGSEVNANDCIACFDKP